MDFLTHMNQNRMVMRKDLIGSWERWLEYYYHTAGYQIYSGILLTSQHCIYTIDYQTLSLEIKHLLSYFMEESQTLTSYNLSDLWPMFISIQTSEHPGNLKTREKDVR